MNPTQGKILVTGAAGFIGSSFVAACNQRGQEVISVDREGFFIDRPEHEGIQFGEVVDLEELIPLLQSDSLASPISSIVHLGACADTTEMDLEYLKRVNLDYSKALWIFATRKKIPFIYASSAATYGEGELGYKDDEASLSQLKPLNPYGQSKQDFDVWALTQDRAGRKPLHWAGFKFFNVYGYGERHKGSMASVVLHAFDQILAKSQIRLFKSHRAGIEDGHQKRDFIFIDDVVDVLNFALEKPIPRGIFNLGTGEARTFLDLARGVFKALGKTEKIDFVETPLSIRDRYQYFTQAEMTRLREAGYNSPFTSLEEGIETYVARLRKDTDDSHSHT